MKQLEEMKHVVYLLKRKSDNLLYVGVTIKNRIKQRLGDHKRSNRFKGIGFDYEILEESTDRNYILKQEEYYIKYYNSYKNGLNDTPSGKGYGHNDLKFTTLGYVYSEESRKKMSESAKKRAKNEGFQIRSQRSKNNWKNPNYLNNQKGKRKGKRLRRVILSDDTIDHIRKQWLIEKPIFEEQIRTEKRTRTFVKTPLGRFIRKYSKIYNVSDTLIRKIIENKCRTEKLPSICKY